MSYFNPLYSQVIEIWSDCKKCPAVKNVILCNFNELLQYRWPAEQSLRDNVALYFNKLVYYYAVYKVESQLI